MANNARPVSQASHVAPMELPGHVGEAIDASRPGQFRHAFRWVSGKVGVTRPLPLMGERTRHRPDGDGGGLAGEQRIGDRRDLLERAQPPHRMQSSGSRQSELIEPRQQRRINEPDPMELMRTPVLGTLDRRSIRQADHGVFGSDTRGPRREANRTN